jgi:hypothetical protein
MIRKLAWIAFFMTTSVSCLDEPDCFSLNNNFVQIAFKKLADGTADALKFSTIETKNKEGATINIKTYEGQTASTVNLPLDYLTNETTYIFRHSDTVTDTMTMKYVSKIQFVSDSCGQRFVLSNLSVVKRDTAFTTLDSVRLLSTIPFKANTTAKTTIEIYRK